MYVQPIATCRGPFCPREELVDLDPEGSNAEDGPAGDHQQPPHVVIVT